MSKKALDSAMRLLARRDYGAIELQTNLMRKGFSAQEASEAVTTCQNLQLQDDSRFVACYSRSRIRQGYGPLKIIHELKTKGVDVMVISQVLEQEQGNWLSYAKEVWSKKTKGVVELSFIDKQKQLRFLQYRGFSMDTITQLVKEF